MLFKFISLTSTSMQVLYRDLQSVETLLFLGLSYNFEEQAWRFDPLGLDENMTCLNEKKRANPHDYYIQIASCLQVVLSVSQRCSTAELGFSHFPLDFIEKFNGYSPVKLGNRVQKPPRGTGFTRIAEYLLFNGKRPVLGAGSFGKVKFALVSGREEMVVKKVYVGGDKGVSDISNEQLVSIVREADIGQHLPAHEGLLPTKDVYISPNNKGSFTAYFFMDRVEGCSVDSETIQSMTMAAKVALAINLGEALGVLAEQGIIHGDLNIKNILCTTNSKLTIFDWGLAAYSQDDVMKLSCRYGSLGSVAPETIRLIIKHMEIPWFVRLLVKGEVSDSRTIANDVWSYGVILFHLFFGVHPFFTQTEAANGIRVSDYLGYRRMQQGTFCAKATKALAAYPSEVCQFFRDIFVPMNSRPPIQACLDKLRRMQALNYFERLPAEPSCFGRFNRVSPTD